MPQEKKQHHSWATKISPVLREARGLNGYYAENIPAGLLVDDARLQPPPASISANDVLPSTLPNAWGGEETTAHAIAEALSTNSASPPRGRRSAPRSTVPVRGDFWNVPRTPAPGRATTPDRNK